MQSAVAKAEAAPAARPCVSRGRVKKGQKGVKGGGGSVSFKGMHVLSLVEFDKGSFWNARKSYACRWWIRFYEKSYHPYQSILII
jgi:hypothetical protein